MSELKPIKGENWEFSRNGWRLNVVVQNVKDADRADEIANFFNEVGTSETTWLGASLSLSIHILTKR